jgi:hypothetical protein
VKSKREEEQRSRERRGRAELTLLRRASAFIGAPGRRVKSKERAEEQRRGGEERGSRANPIYRSLGVHRSSRDRTTSFGWLVRRGDAQKI